MYSSGDLYVGLGRATCEIEWYKLETEVHQRSAYDSSLGRQ
jgi:hypothetical protein